MGISQSKANRLLDVMDTAPPIVELPTFPDEDIPAEEILDSLEKRFDQKLKRENAIKWFQVKVNDPKPTGWVFVGDPHLGSNCHVKLLRDDVKIMAETEGIHCVNLGDTVDGWGIFDEIVRRDRYFKKYGTTLGEVVFTGRWNPVEGLADREPRHDGGLLDLSKSHQRR